MSATPTAPSGVTDRRLPPVAELVVTSLAMMLAGGVYLASSLPKAPVLAPAVALMTVGAALTAAAIAMLSRVGDFAWDTFFLVARWALAAYAVIAGILGFVFIYDHTRGATLAVLLCTLAIFAVDVPTVIGFTVARYQDASRR